MLTHIFRVPEYTPSPYTSICTSGRLVVFFRRNGLAGICLSPSLRPFVFVEIYEEIVDSLFIDYRTVLCLAKMGNVIILDLETLRRSTLELEATCIAASFQPLAQGACNFFYANSRNEICQYRGETSARIFAVDSKVVTMLATASYVIFATSSGWLSVISNGSVVTEIDLKVAPAKIACVAPDLYCACGEDGCVYLFNPMSQIVLDRLQVSEHPLNEIVPIDGTVHVSGVDSRLFCMKILKNKLVKDVQADPHSAEVLAMCTDNGRLLSAGEDCLLVASTVGAEGYKIDKHYDTSVVVGSAKDHLFASSGSVLGLFAVGSPERDEDSAEMNGYVDPANELITFKLEKSVLERLLQKKTPFRHLLNIKQSGEIISSDVSFDQRYACVSTSKRAILYSLFTGSKLHVEKLREFSAAKWVKFTEGTLVLQGLDFIITVLDLDSFETKELKYESLIERIQVAGESIVFLDSKKWHNLKTGETQACLEGRNVLASASEGDTCFCLCDSSLVEIKNGSEEVRDLTDHISAAPLFRDISHMFGGRVFANSTHLFVLGENISTYEIGPMIHGVVSHKDEIVVVQSAWKELSKGFKKSVFKRKYSNR